MAPFDGLQSLAGYAGIAAIGGAVVAFWSQARGFVSGMFTWFIVSCSMEERTAMIFMRHLRDGSRQAARGRSSYGWAHEFIRRRMRWGTVAYEESVSGRVFLYRGWRPVLVTSESGDSPSGAPGGRKEGRTFRVLSVRWAVDLEALLAEAFDRHNELSESLGKGRRHFIRRVGSDFDDDEAIDVGPVGGGMAERRYVGFGDGELGSPTPERPFGNLSYPPEILAAVDLCRQWLGSKEWYRARGLSWRLGMLLGGPPGTGKTSWVRAIAQELDLPVLVLDLSAMTNKTLVKAWSRARSHSPAIVLLEDLDRVGVALQEHVAAGAMRFPDRDGKMDSWNPLTLDCLLNCISGIEPSEGILVVATANDPGRLDPALGVFDEGGVSSRPGRLDFYLHFPPLDARGRAEIAVNILGPTADEGLVRRLVADGEGETGAQFTQRVAGTALKDYWKAGSPAEGRP